MLIERCNAVEESYAMLAGISRCAMVHRVVHSRMVCWAVGTVGCPLNAVTLSVLVERCNAGFCPLNAVTL